MRIFGSGADTDTFDAEVRRPFWSTTITGICSSPPYVPGVTVVDANFAVVTDDVCNLAVETESSVIVPVVSIFPIPAARINVPLAGVKLRIKVEPESE